MIHVESAPGLAGRGNRGKNICTGKPSGRVPCYMAVLHLGSATSGLRAYAVSMLFCFLLTRPPRLRRFLPAASPPCTAAAALPTGLSAWGCRAGE